MTKSNLLCTNCACVNIPRPLPRPRSKCKLGKSKVCNFFFHPYRLLQSLYFCSCINTDYKLSYSIFFILDGDCGHNFLQYHCVPKWKKNLILIWTCFKSGFVSNYLEFSYFKKTYVYLIGFFSMNPKFLKTVQICT